MPNNLKDLLDRAEGECKRFLSVYTDESGVDVVTRAMEPILQGVAEYLKEDMRVYHAGHKHGPGLMPVTRMKPRERVLNISISADACFVLHIDGAVGLKDDGSLFIPQKPIELKEILEAVNLTPTKVVSLIEDSLKANYLKQVEMESISLGNGTLAMA